MSSRADKSGCRGSAAKASGANSLSVAIRLLEELTCSFASSGSS
jgi:hypothetical protein